MLHPTIASRPTTIYSSGTLDGCIWTFSPINKVSPRYFPGTCTRTFFESTSYWTRRYASGVPTSDQSEARLITDKYLTGFEETRKHVSCEAKKGVLGYIRDNPRLEYVDARAGRSAYGLLEIGLLLKPCYIDCSSNSTTQTPKYHRLCEGLRWRSALLLVKAVEASTPIYTVHYVYLGQAIAPAMTKTSS